MKSNNYTSEDFIIIQFSLHTRTRFDQVLDSLGLSIVAGTYPEGTRLPLEATLCEEFGISRPVVREAVKALSAKGMIIAKPRIGLLVQPRSDWNLLDPKVLGWLIQSTSRASFDTLLLGVRQVIEPECAAQAASHATRAQVEQLNAAQLDMAMAFEWESQLDAYLLFHQTIMAAIRNELLAHIGNTLLTAQVSALRLADGPKYPLVPDHHHRLYQAIAARNSELARTTALELVQELHPYSETHSTP